MVVLRNLLAVAGAIVIGYAAVPVSLVLMLSYTEGAGDVLGALVASSFVGIQAFVGALVALLLVANRRTDAGVIVAILAVFALVGEHVWLLTD